jgi:hypothetical protein
MNAQIKQQLLNAAANEVGLIEFDGIAEYCENDSWFGGSFSYEDGQWSRNTIYNGGFKVVEHEYTSEWKKFKIVISKADERIVKVIR